MSQARLKRLLPHGSTGAFWLATFYLSTLFSVFLTKFRHSSHQVATQLSSERQVDIVPEPILPEKNLFFQKKMSTV